VQSAHMSLVMMKPVQLSIPCDCGVGIKNKVGVVSGIKKDCYAESLGVSRVCISRHDEDSESQPLRQ